MESSSHLRHRTFGTRLDEWISLTPGELSRDAVGLWQVVQGLKSGFGLSGAELEAAVRASISSLVAAGARPVQGNSSDKQWRLRADLALPQEATVDKIVGYWHSLGRDPDLGDIWFAKPGMYVEAP